MAQGVEACQNAELGLEIGAISVQTAICRGIAGQSAAELGLRVRGTSYDGLDSLGTPPCRSRSVEPIQDLYPS